MTIVLASASPRRRELLAQLNLLFEIVPSSLSERDPGREEDPVEYALELARSKAQAVGETRPGRVVLAADTVVALDGQILNKPVDEEDAKRMLLLLRDQTHSVFTAVAVRCGPKEHFGAMEARVRMRNYSQAEIEEYVAGGEPMDKAGAYAIQAGGGRLVDRVDGCYETVVGLPLCLAARLVQECGVAVSDDAMVCKAGSRTHPHR